MNIERKTFQSGEFKVIDPVKGIAEMIVSVFNVVDSGNDVVMPGFFAESIARRRTPDGRPKVKGVWAHDWSIPVAKTLDARELMPGDPRLPDHLRDLGGLWVKAQFNLETQRGREAFSDLQFGTIDEFSFGYEVTEYSYDEDSGIRKLLKGEWYEWSPVLVGMNEHTVLLNTKARFKGVDPGDVSTELAPEDTPWEAPDLEDFTDQAWNDLSDSEKRRIAKHFAWAAAMPPEKYGDLKFPHHRPSDGRVVWRGVANAAARLDQASIPEADKDKIRNHLARHYRAFDKPIPWEKSLDGLLTYAGEGETALAVVQSYVQRSKSLADLRRKEGRVLSEANRNRLKNLADALRTVLADIDDLLAATEPESEKTARIAANRRLYLEYQRMLARLNGVSVA